MGFSVRHVLSWIGIAVFAVLTIWFVCGCAQSQLSTPSGVGVTSSINRASQYNDVAVVQNQKAMTNVQRIEAKAAVIQKYWGK